MRHWLPLLALATMLGIVSADREALATVRWVRDLWVCSAAQLLFVAGFSSGRTRQRVLALAALVLAAAVGAGSLLARIEASAPRLTAPTSVVIEAQLGVRGGSGPRMWRTLDRVRVVGALPWHSPTRVRVPSRLRLSLEPGDPWISLPPGTRIRTALRLSPLRPARNPGEAEFARQHRRQGLGASARLVDPVLREETARPRGMRPWVDALRVRHGQALVAQGDGGALLAALALGWRVGLSPELREAFQALGLSHLLAVSGLHLGLVGGAVFFLVRSVLVGRRIGGADPRRAALLAAIGAAGAYATLAGWPVSVQRAFGMAAVAAVAVGLRRPVAPVPLLAGVAWIVLCIDPAALFSAGAQFSFAATAALLVARPGGIDGRDEGERERPWVRAQVALHATSAAVLATWPIGAAHFGVSSGPGWLANLVAVPIAGIVWLPLAFAAVVVSATFGPESALLEHAVQGSQWLIELVQLGARDAGSSLGPRPAGGWLLLAAGAAVVAIASRRTLATVGAALVVTLGGAAASPPAWGPPEPRVVFLDVGQGDATLLQGEGTAILIDGGTRIDGFDAGARRVLPALRALGVRRLDLVVATHRDLDHRGGLEAVLAALPTDALWLPAGSEADPAFTKLEAVARSRGVRVERVAEGDARLRRGPFEIDVLWPPRDRPPRGNDGSIVLRVSAGGPHLLLPGDLEAAGEAALLQSAAEVGAQILKLPHHGSRSSSTVAFLDAVAPEVAVVSAARFSRWQMPHPEVEARLAERSVGWLWPARDGAIACALGPDAPSGCARGEPR